MLIPSAIDPDMAPPGRHVMSCFVQYAPYDLEGGWTDEKREAFGDRVIDVLAEYIPNIREIILHRQVLTPVEIESMVGITGGNIFHGELNLAQLFCCGRRPGTVNTKPLCPVFTSVVPAPIPAAVSWARPAGWRHRLF
jgi:phytoene dehydrogenase-like protein